MAAPSDGLDQGRKRKRETNGVKSRKAPKSTKSLDTRETQILLLEQQILESPTHYGKIEELQTLMAEEDSRLLAAVALCRVFCRLIAGEQLVKEKSASEESTQSVQRLRVFLREYVSNLCSWIGSPDATTESTALTLLMRIVKEEASGGSRSAAQSWRNERASFQSLVRALVRENDAEGARQQFVEKYIEEYDDVRFYTFVAVKQCLGEAAGAKAVGNAIELLSQIEGVPEADEELEDWYGDAPEDKSPLLSLNGHRKTAREAWLAVFRTPLSVEQRKSILNITTAQLLPWFTNHIELLADFLTDSFQQGGAISLLALSGIFHLMTVKNLDYPDFYKNLYSLLDEDVLHSKHRSRFFRLLETFMSSTHLPVAMVASFMKRLSRLALQAPPGAVVWIVPWIYNQVKQHPSCAFMLHRPFHPAHAIYASNPKYAEEGMHDPFDMSQRDPMITAAIDSSLWELETLSNHFHPNVATLAKIIGEQFTKRDYQLEDFLDYSYATLVDAELGKEMKKVPVVEWDIPKRILTSEDGLNDLGLLYQSAIGATG
ncbi:hypothetical protein CKM354_000301900 [Cercospora kikuchii]|uniref:CCAAT-binding factor domain-containing protein n=1 Tax=Cercospora kikuchii TaxID=84275 RepID=A0A9P3FEC8_9PEZI|nr:ribosome biosynthesis protein NOC4 [Cercospora kikuchii]GIZ39644.1 hypothetical protein CKM354_000301900 [Cercospora kikuchii]